MSKPSNNNVRIALALAFGVILSGNSAFGIPGGIPGLSRSLGCGNCRIETNRSNMPTRFAPYMTEEQKKIYKKSLNNRKAKQ